MIKSGVETCVFSKQGEISEKKGVERHLTITIKPPLVICMAVIRSWFAVLHSRFPGVYHAITKHGIMHTKQTLT